MIHLHHCSGDNFLKWHQPEKTGETRRQSNVAASLPKVPPEDEEEQEEADTPPVYFPQIFLISGSGREQF